MTDVDTGIAVLRAAVGATMIAHGWNHLFGGGGVSGTANWFASMGLRPPRIHALLSGAGELAAGAMMLVGLFTSLSAAFVVGSMTVAGVIAHRKNGFFVFKDGYEYVLVLAVVAAFIGFAGPGRFSADHAIGLAEAWQGTTGAAIAGSGVLGAAVLLAACWRPGTQAA